MSPVSSKKKSKYEGTRKEGRTQMVLSQRVMVMPVNSDDSTLPLEVSGDLEAVNLQQDNQLDTTVGDVTLHNIENGYSSEESLTDLDEEETGFKETDPMRRDRPINTDRWEDEEVDALMIALNINREAIKFHFDGPGGGRDVKRQGWRDVAAYVNDVADTHRTVRACRNKADDYTQRVKAKYNKLRYQITRTGRGRIANKYLLKPTESKALDYLKEEAVKGIPGVKVMSLPEDKKQRKPSSTNKKLLWRRDREDKPDYSKVDMKRQGVPKNYKEKNKRRLAREACMKKKKENAIYQKAERKKEREQAKQHTEERRRQKQKEEKHRKKEERREKERERAARRERKRQRALVREARKEAKKKRAERKEEMKESKKKKDSKRAQEKGHMTYKGRQIKEMMINTKGKKVKGSQAKGQTKKKAVPK